MCSASAGQGFFCLDLRELTELEIFGNISDGCDKKDAAGAFLLGPKCIESRRKFPKTLGTLGFFGGDIAQLSPISTEFSTALSMGILSL